MEEKAQETPQVSLATLAGTSGYVGNPFLTAYVSIFDLDCGWVRVDSFKPSKTPGKIIVVRSDNGKDEEVDATYRFCLRLI